MGGVLLLASGVQPAFEEHDFSVVVMAYVVMRLAMVAQWLRASRHAGGARAATLTYAVGVALVQALWFASLFLPERAFPVAVVALILAEVSVPVIAEHRGSTPWHPHHITERYGAFTLILLGESLLASANALIESLHSEGELGSLVGLGVLTLVATAALWWIYFWPAHHHAIGGLGRSMVYGYGHYVVFAAAGAFSAGIEVEIDVLTGKGVLHQPWSAFAYTVPIALFLLGTWVLAIRSCADRVVNVAVPVAALLVLIDPLFPLPIALTALILAVLVGILVWRRPVGVEE